jgi:site-specific recombinase XerD
LAERDITPQQDFEAWLRQRRLVPEKRIPFVLAWVRRFQRLRQSPPQHTPLDSEQLLVEMEQLLRLRHYAPRTMQTYLSWARRFLQYLKQSGGTLGAEGVRAYLSHLATARNVASATQNQAFNALLFLCRHVLHADVGDMAGTVRARRGLKLPVVLSIEETRSILENARGIPGLILELIYGGGLRISGGGHFACQRHRLRYAHDHSAVRQR